MSNPPANYTIMEGNTTSPSPGMTSAFWRGEWERVAIQVDAFTCWIKINYDIYYLLGQGGRDFFVQQASILLNRSVEFFIDDSNRKRIFLANRGDLQALFPCQLEPWVANGLSRFFPTLQTQQLKTSATDNSTPGTHDETGSAISSSDASASPGSSHIDNSVQQSIPAKMDFERTDVNLSGGFGHPQAQHPNTGAGIQPLQNQNLQAQHPNTGAGIQPLQNQNPQPPNLNVAKSASNFSFSSPVGTPAYPGQPGSMKPPTNMPVTQTPRENARLSSSRKRKALNELNPRDQRIEE
ncbi:hypothetical protein F4823DRAFT_633121 [Ustulina deusta]|nr:hypothetical protein F4823DRAFT_633121 [Ustulina deusta]